MDSVLCGANASNMKYWFNEEKYSKIPGPVKDDLKRICVTYCSDVGGAIVLSFDNDSHLCIQTIDPIDDIGSELKIKQIRNDNMLLFKQLERFEREIVNA